MGSGIKGNLTRGLCLSLCALSVLLAGCAPLTTKRIHRADAIVASSIDRRIDCTTADACAKPSPFLDQAYVAFAKTSGSGQPHNAATLLEVGEDSLVARINLIRAARHSIDIQTYIWAKDDAGLLVLDELVNAARRGVKVRILADQLGSLNDPKLLARLARASINLEIRLYNPIFDSASNNFAEYAASALCCFHKINQRMHTKLFLVDDAVGITGGRNYEDRYYDWDPDLDFLDRDAMIAGPVAREMAESFDIFWNHPRAVPLTHLRDANASILDTADAQPWLTPIYGNTDRVARVQAEAEDPDFLRTHFTAATLNVGRVDYFYDLPSKAKPVHGYDAKALTHDLMQLLSNAKREIVLQTPYLVLTERAGDIFTALHAKQPPVHVLISTNSLASTDAMAVYALSYKHRKKFLVDFGFDIHELKPHPLDATSMIDNYLLLTEQNQDAAQHYGRRGPVPLKPDDFGPRVSLHAKSLVVDGGVAMVGTHNFDPRSDDLNTEGGVVVYDPVFAGEVRASIVNATQPQNSWLIAPRDPIPVLSDVSNAIGEVSRHLPLFDLWPFDYATSYELKPGCNPLPPTDPDFLKCYNSVGDFPEVNLSLTAIITRFITAFGVGVQGVM